MNSVSQWVIWQLVDSAFPGGGFAHSSGLEAARQLGEVADSAGLKAFLKANLLQMARGSVPFALAAARSIQDMTRGQRSESTALSLAELDRRYDVFLTSTIANRASRAQGVGFLAVATRAIGGTAISSISNLFRQEKFAGHWPVALGAVCGTLGIEGEAVAQLLLFITLRGTVSAAVRLGIVGPMEGQSLQFELHSYGESLATRAADWTIDQAAQTSPVVELLQGMHDRLYSRLFLS